MVMLWPVLWVICGIPAGVLFTWGYRIPPYTAGDLLLGVVVGAVTGPMGWVLLGLDKLHTRLERVVLEKKKP